MASEHAQGRQSHQILAIDEARYLLKSVPPQSMSLREPTADEVANFTMDMLCTYAEIDLSDEQRAEAIKFLRSLAPRTAGNRPG